LITNVLFLLLPLSANAQISGKSIPELRCEALPVLQLSKTPFFQHANTPFPQYAHFKSSFFLQKTAVPIIYSYQNLAFFCKLEVQLEKAVKLPVKFRLGDVEYVDWLEGKRK
jgi:hypothetical protein